jgi:hypothetical protein
VAAALYNTSFAVLEAASETKCYVNNDCGGDNIKNIYIYK